MCVRYSPLDAEYDAKRVEWIKDRFQDIPMPGDVFPGDVGPFVSSDGELVEARWGLQPGWAKEASFGKKNAYNARSETVAEKPTFRSAFKHRRCVVPAKAFYERAEGRWLRVSPNDGAFWIAGLWEEANERTEGLPTFTMVTTEPNAAMAKVHDRMPVILAQADAEGWMDPKADLRGLHGLLIPCPAEWTTVEDAGPVGKRKKAEEKGLF